VKILLNFGFLGVYVGAFYIRKLLPMEPVAIAVTMILCLLLMQVYKKYFINSYEKAFFYIIAIHIFLESITEANEGFVFYLSAIAYVLVILLYRKFVGKACGNKCLLSGKELTKQ
jgi:hypothetical protein